MAGYVVQSAQGTTTTSPGTVTLAAATRAGNTLIAMASVRNAGASNGTLTTVTLGGLPDNFAQAASFGTGTAPAQLYWWLDPLCAGGQTKVAFTTAGGAGTEALTMSVLEVGGMIPIPSGTGAVDVSSGSISTAGSAIWNSGTVTTGWPTEVWTGMVVAAGTHPASYPNASPWIALASQPNGGTVSLTQAGYLLWASTGETPSSLVYSGTFSAAQGYVAGAVAFPAMTFSPSLPDYAAGAGPQQGDMFSLATAPLGFTQQKVVLRVAQLNTTNSLPFTGIGNPVQYDTVYEDPYQAWNVAQYFYTPPYTGWYQVTTTVSCGTCAANTIVQMNNGTGQCAGMVIPTTGGIVQGTAYRFLVANQAVYPAFCWATSSSTVFTSNSPGSTMELTWLGFSAG